MASLICMDTLSLPAVWRRQDLGQTGLSFYTDGRRWAGDGGWILEFPQQHYHQGITRDIRMNIIRRASKRSHMMKAPIRSETHAGSGSGPRRGNTSQSTSHMATPLIEAWGLRCTQAAEIEDKTGGREGSDIQVGRKPVDHPWGPTVGVRRTNVVRLQDAEGSSVAFGPKPERPNCSFIMSHAIEYSRAISERSDECVECAWWRPISEACMWAERLQRQNFWCVSLIVSSGR